MPASGATASGATVIALPTARSNGERPRVRLRVLES
jgi:hypothetical protein